MISPLVSIIIPCFNRQDFIGITIESVVKQSYENWELFIIDDGSTDNSKQIIENFCKEDSRIHCIDRNRLPKGAPTCRNIGLETCTGSFIIFLDSDDFLASFCLQNRVEYMNNNSKLDFAIFDGLIFIDEPYDSNVLISNYKDKEVILQFLKFDIPWITLQAFWRRSFLLNKNIKWDPVLKAYQDVDFHLKAVISDNKYSFADCKPDCFWRQHIGDSIGKDIFKKNLIESHIHLYWSVSQLLSQNKMQNKKANLYWSRFIIGQLVKQVFLKNFDQCNQILKLVKRTNQLTRLQFFLLEMLVNINSFSYKNNVPFIRGFILNMYKYILLKNFFTLNTTLYFKKHRYLNEIS